MNKYIELYEYYWKDIIITSFKVSKVSTLIST